MTVKELIEALSQYGDDVDVVIFNERFQSPIEDVVFDMGDGKVTILIEPEDDANGFD